MNKLAQLAAVLVLLSLTAACATIERTIVVDYVPEEAAAPLADAAGHSVSVAGVDARLTNRARVSVHINGYGMEMAPIRSDRPAPEIVQAALESALAARGFTVGAGSAAVEASVTEFYNQFHTGVFAGAADATVAFNVTVRDASGAIVFERAITGAERLERLQMAGASNAEKALEMALAKAVADLVADQAFIDALTKPTATLAAAGVADAGL